MERKEEDAYRDQIEIERKYSQKENRQKKGKEREKRWIEYPLRTEK